MTATMNGRRPSPRPRPPIVTDSEAQPSTGASQEVPAERETVDQDSTLYPEAITEGSPPWCQRAWAATADYFTPPAFLTEHPPTVAELADYARRGAWTTQHGPLRALGVWWHLLISLPMTARCRWREWIWQRPGRTITALLLIKLVALTGPGGWVVDHLIYPAYRVAGWVFL